jgi:hypothetical protein
MRVDAKFSASSLASAAPSRGQAAQRFTLGGGGSTERTGQAASAAPLTTVDALLALQGEGDPAERRRRSLKRGHDLLDTLDRLKASLLSGRVAPGQLQTLAAQIAAQRGSSGDPGLDEVIAHIDLRAQVELAKLRRG